MAIVDVVVQTRGPGLYPITAMVQQAVADTGLLEGLCTVMIQHTSASLIIQENADPAVMEDLQAWLARLVPEGDALYTHTAEGPDDMPAHVKSALTATSLGIPVRDRRLALGTWQGVFLWEHRRRGSRRHCVVHVA